MFAHPPFDSRRTLERRCSSLSTTLAKNAKELGTDYSPVHDHMQMWLSVSEKADSPEPIIDALDLILKGSAPLEVFTGSDEREVAIYLRKDIAGKVLYAKPETVVTYNERRGVFVPKNRVKRVVHGLLRTHLCDYNAFLNEKNFTEGPYLVFRTEPSDVGRRVVESSLQLTE